MDFQNFVATLTQPQPPAEVSDVLLALWYDGKGDWHSAHELAQVTDSPANCWIHAYLHRKEGDVWNAQYWYHRAGKPMPETSLEEEWQLMVQELLTKRSNEKPAHNS